MRALMIMIKAYRLKKMRVYINTLQRKFVNAKQTKDYGKSILWPAPPPSLRQTTSLLRHAYNRWRAYMILGKIPKQQWAEMRVKIAAASVLYNKRTSYGLVRKWEGDYLAKHDENTSYVIYNEAVKNLRNNNQGSGNVLFSSFVTKFNKFNKCAERVILITDRQLFKLDALKFRNMKEGVGLTDLTGVSVSPGHDQLIVLHCVGGNDLVVSLHGTKQEDRIGEIVGVVCSAYFK